MDNKGKIEDIGRLINDCIEDRDSEPMYEVVLRVKVIHRNIIEVICEHKTTHDYNYHE